MVKIKKIYRIVQYVKKDYKQYNPNDDSIAIDNNEIHLTLKRSSDAIKVAELADIKDFEVKQITLDKEGYERRDNVEIVYTTSSVKDWKYKVKIQNELREIRKKKVIEAINLLSTRVILYKKEGFLILAVRDEAKADSYRGLEVKYRGEISYNGEKLGYGLGEFITDDNKVRGRKLAEGIYERENQKKYHATSYVIWKDILRGLPEEYIDKHKEILRIAQTELKRWQGKIENIKAGL